MTSKCWGEACKWTGTGAGTLDLFVSTLLQPWNEPTAHQKYLPQTLRLYQICAHFLFLSFSKQYKVPMIYIAFTYELFP